MGDSGIGRLNAKAELMKACAIKLTRLIRNPACPDTKIRRELKPFGAFAWSSKLARLVGVGELHTMSLLLRQSKLNKKDYRTLKQRISTYVADNS